MRNTVSAISTAEKSSANCGEELRKLRKRLPHFAGAENFPSRLPYGGAGGAIVGQLIIPVPVLGAVVGGTIGTLVGKAAGHGEGFLASKLIKDKPVDLPVIVRNTVYTVTVVHTVTVDLTVTLVHIYCDISANIL